MQVDGAFLILDFILVQYAESVSIEIPYFKTYFLSVSVNSLISFMVITMPRST
ncbi:hypothetical protein MWMV17_MWMV17_00623 [Acinetobacter calcoaceticus]|jgi:hypothetical protein|uniref:Uncharacterized protein n=1 Tax=Acinetobacter calcoaceticus DSM 30006 = CIP 81.8 TaxID=981331 RepID=A0ABN0K664_ACICA|nr:hypothetical protein F997_02682 [Acinetobacter calcoaceticus NIPH 13]ENV98947.1 hypothetical protein F936_02030 [Acinetobacter calcoaceticus DSM 30006 = CIP 81.8]CAI3110412.1 hypothetical protein MWMV17_MWMV17_00623 [Acinetobacter calcoaceticus]SUU55950.1 Uncharacterised protein [Acinetobacter calcoaceticus]